MYIYIYIHNIFELDPFNVKAYLPTTLHTKLRLLTANEIDRAPCRRPRPLCPPAQSAVVGSLVSIHQ